MKRPKDISREMRMAKSPLDSKRLENFEKLHGKCIPSFLLEILRDANGAGFHLDAVLRFPGHSIAIVGILGIGSTEVGFIEGVAMLIEDRLDCSKRLPFAYTFSGDHFVFEKHGGAVGFWNHETLEVLPVSSSVDEFFNMIEFADPQAELKKICANGCLADLEHNFQLDLKSGSVCELAAEFGNLSLLKECVLAGYRIGQSFSAAAENCNFNIVDYLLGCGFDINEEFMGSTCLDDFAESSTAYQELAKRGALSAKR